ncbi:rap1 GTPase-activating protein 1-like [Sergentomyia squamirostris]
MSAICFVCNLPIMSHQVGLVWQGGNGWDEFMREQLEESTVRQRLGGRRDSAAQISSPNTPPIASVPRRRRSSIAQLTDILREWSGTSCKKNVKNTLNRRETLADLARSFPWNRTQSIDIQGVQPSSSGGYKRRESSAEVSGGGRSSRSRQQDSRQYSQQSDFARNWNKRQDSQVERDREVNEVRDSRRGSGDSLRSYRHAQSQSKSLASMRKKRESTIETSVSVSTGPEPESVASSIFVDSSCQALPPPVVSVTSSITPPATSPTTLKSLKVRRDSQTQCGRINRRESKSSPDIVPKMQRLQRQATTYDEPPGNSRRDSQPTLTTDGEERRARRDSLSPDSVTAARGGRRDSRSHLSPDRSRDHDNEIHRRCREKIRRQSSSTARTSRSPDSSSCCSSRDPSPSACPPTYVVDTQPSVRPSIRRQSTTEEILIARGFRRQSTTDEMIRCRNFRRQSSQSDDVCRYRGRRDSSAQIIDGTIGTMTVETTSTVFDSSTQTDPSPQYENNHYHEECLRCNSCGINLSGPNQKRARRFKNHILCDLHFADVALMECSDFMQQLRSFKPQSLGCAVARRKSSTTLIFPLPPQACSDEFCEEYPHNLIPTPGYWIECSRQKISTAGQGWNDSGSENDNESETRDRCTDLCEDDEEDSDIAPRKKTTIEEQWEQQQGFELTSVEQETYEKHFYGTEHWNYFTNDEDLGPVILSIKQETLNGRDQFRILVRAISYTVHGLIPASCVFADRYNREEVVRSLGKEVNLNPPLTLGQLQDTPEELLKLDQVFIKSELKVGVIYINENQYTEEEILENNENSPLFEEFLQLLGEKVRLKGFDKYKGGLDTVHDLTGLYSVHTNWRGIEIMFHVSTMLPYERHDIQKLQRKRHIGNDIVCVVFLEADNTLFSPACIKSHFLHTFILVRVSARIKRKPTRYEVSVVTRDEVGAYKPYLWEQSVFVRDQMFREWILTKIVNGERASYSAPKFARMQERTRSQMLEDIVANLANHAETGQIPKPYRRGSWRPIGHMRPSSPLLDSVRDQFEDHDQLASDFQRAFLNADPQIQNPQLFDVAFLVGQSKQKVKLIGVRAILGVRSRVFQEMLYGIQTGFGSPQVPVAEILARPVPALLSPQTQKKSSNFLQVPDVEAPRPKSVPSSPMVKRAFSRLGTITGWGKSIKKQNSQLNADDKKKWASIQDFSNGKDGGKEKNPSQFLVPGLSVCADVQKVDRAKLAQTEFNIIEFDSETFRVLLNYLHTGSCPLTCISIPGLICAAEHYDLPELLQACFHHAKQFLRIEYVCSMLISLESYYWRYTSASELVNMILAFVETKAHQLFKQDEFLNLSESIVQMIMARSLEIQEIRKFEAMLAWARHKVKTKALAAATNNRGNSRSEFRTIMDRLTRDLKLHRISPQDLIKIVLPSKAIKNERILETLMYQANSGIYRIQDSYLEECQQRLKNQDSRFSEWSESFDYGL